MVTVISLGGSVLFENGALDINYVKQLAKFFKSQKEKFVVVSGGGVVNKMYVEPLRGSLSNFSLDEIGIAVTRVNALVIKEIFTREGINVYPGVVTTLDELKKAVASNSMVLMGGLMPGITTDAVSTLVCEAIGSKKLVNIGVGSYIYSKKPEEEGAEKIEEISYDKMLEIASKYDKREARTNFIFDIIGVLIARRSNIKVLFIDKKVESLSNAIAGNKFEGSTLG